MGFPISTVVQVVDAVLHVPVELLVEESVPGSPFTGDGRLTRPRPGVDVAAWGLSWSFLTIPPRLGVSNGAVPVWNVRLLQLAAFHFSRSAEYPMEIFDVHHDAGAWLWQAPFPAAIGFSCYPGVSVRLSWLLFSPV
jgi:hypothetical protein